MKKTAVLCTALLLTACSRTTMFEVDLTIRDVDILTRSSVVFSSQKVIERRAGALEGVIPEADASDDGVKARITAVLQKKKTAGILMDQLTRPFVIDLMLAAQEGEEPDVVTEKFGGFIRSGINEEDIVWAQAEEDPNGSAQAVLLFSENGKEELKTFLTKNIGKQIALFVNGGLVSTYQVQEDSNTESIVIAGIPSMELATIFTDDVVVGVNVTFSPPQ